MRKRILCKCMAVALAGCMILQANVFAAEPDADILAAPEAVEDAYVIDDAEDDLEVDDAAVDVAEDDSEIIGPETEDENVGTEDAETDDTVIEEAADEIEIEDFDEDEIFEDAVAVSDAYYESDVSGPGESDAAAAQREGEALVGAIKKITLGTYSLNAAKWTKDPNYEN